MEHHRTTVRGPRPASLCSVEILKFVRAHDGQDKVSGRGTGFHYRDRSGQVWLVTNWHVLTGRRPDNPAMLVGKAMASPTKIGVAYPSKRAGEFLPHIYLDLYDAGGRPRWCEYNLAMGIDVAAIPVEVPNDALCPCVQDFAQMDTRALEPGLEVTIVGQAFEHSVDTPYPIWKSGRIASEPQFLVHGIPQVLIDVAALPGMSGSPVYRISNGHSLPLSSAGAQALQGGLSALDKLLELDLSSMEPAMVLSFVGVYAGATGSASPESMSFGRMFMGSIVDLLVNGRQWGSNPFPPDPIA